MYSEYVFDEKKSEIALNKLKAIIFDIVNTEECKLSDIMKKVAEAEDSDIKNKLIDLCNQHKENIFRIFEVFNVLNDLMQKIDNFSKDIRELENESVAEIVSNYIEQQNNTKTEKAEQSLSEDHKIVGQEQSYTDQENLDNKVEENVTQVNVEENDERTGLGEQSELNNDQQNLDKKVEENVTQDKVDENNDEIKSSLEGEEAVHEIVPNASIATNDGQIFSQDMMEKDNDSAEQEEIVDIFSQNNDNETTQNNNLSVENNGESVAVTVDDNLNKENEVIQNGNEIIENNAGPNIKTVSDNSSEIQDMSDDEKPVIDLSSVQNVSVDSNLDNEISVTNDSTDVVAGAETTSSPESEEQVISQEKFVDSSIQSDVTSNVETTGTSIPVISETSEDGIDNNYVFEKKDNNEPKVILTTANQVSKLRDSRNNNESILTAKQFFKLENSEENTNLETSSMVFPEDVVNNEVTNDVVTTTEDSQEMSKENQMEMMMQQITDFYKEGKVDEAQALSDKVSELNREIQQKQKTLAA